MKNYLDYKTRGYKEGDEHGITNLFREVFGKEMAVSQWKWKYYLPGRGKIYSKVADDSSGNVIGHAGAIPLRGIFHNRPIQFFQIADVMVHSAARGFLGRKNVFDELMKTLFEDIGEMFTDVFCYGFPGVRPYLLGERVKVYERIEPAIECDRALHRSLFNPFETQEVDWDDDRLNDLWSTLSPEYSLSLVRDKNYLDWRYVANPFFSYRLHGFFRHRKLDGWAVTRSSEGEVFVVDLFVGRNRCGSALKALQNYLVSQGERSIRICLPENMRQLLRGCTMKETGIVVTNMVWGLPLKTSEVKDALYYTMGDIDVF